jgi:hypothetical protein
MARRQEAEGGDQSADEVRAAQFLFLELLNSSIES